MGSRSGRSLPLMMEYFPIQSRLRMEREGELIPALVEAEGNPHGLDVVTIPLEGRESIETALALLVGSVAVRSGAGADAVDEAADASGGV